MPTDSLTITDNRTGKTYVVPIEGGTVKAMDLRQIRTSEEDFGTRSSSWRSGAASSRWRT
jgi:citrate synthase